MAKTTIAELTLLVNQVIQLEPNYVYRDIDYCVFCDVAMSDTQSRRIPSAHEDKCWITQAKISLGIEPQPKE